jgi:hypothetical protein
MNSSPVSIHRVDRRSQPFCIGCISTDEHSPEGSCVTVIIARTTHDKRALAAAHFRKPRVLIMRISRVGPDQRQQRHTVVPGHESAQKSCSEAKF